MSDRRRVEVFSAGCPCCDRAVQTVRDIACPSCEVEVLDIRQAEVAERAELYGIGSVPAVAIDGALAGCCSGRGVNAAMLKAAGVGTPLV